MDTEGVHRGRKAGLDLLSCLGMGAENEESTHTLWSSTSGYKTGALNKKERRRSKDLTLAYLSCWLN